MRSLITSKYQTTIPKEVRDTLKLSVPDAVEWRINGNVAVVYPTQRAFLSRRGSVTTSERDHESHEQPHNQLQYKNFRQLKTSGKLCVTS